MAGFQDNPGEPKFAAGTGTAGRPWNSGGAIVRKPGAAAWYRTWTFYGSVALAGAVLLFLAYQFRVRRMRETERLLEATVAARMAEWAQAKSEAELANQADSDLLAVVGHGMQTPLNDVIRLAAILLEAPANPEQLPYLNMVKSSADALLTVSNSMLDFSKSDTRKMELDGSGFDFRESAEMVAVPAREPVDE